MGGPFVGYDPSGVNSWQSSLNSVHEEVIAALNKYRTTAQQNAEVAHGTHFTNLNDQCEDITNKHLADHNELHAQYTKATRDLVQGVAEVAGGSV